MAMNISKMNQSELYELSQNRSCDDIRKLYFLLEESVRHNLSARLIDTSIYNPMNVCISLEFGACGLSCAEMPTIDRIYQETSDGTIYVRFEKNASDCDDENDGYIDIDELHIEDKIQIVEDLCWLTKNINDMKNLQLIDLGLPSGTLWADRNIGANNPEKYGDYFRFGETTPFTEDSPEYVYDDIDESIAGTDRDAATVNLGSNYRMPTFDQIKELLDDCKWKWTKQNGVNGMKVTGPNGNSIFFPASGCRYGGDGTLNCVGSYGYAWSATPDGGDDGRVLSFYSGGWYCANYCRVVGFTVRAVAK